MSEMPRRYWVGGATGFLGSHLVRTLLDAGHEVVAVSRTGGEVHGFFVHPVDVLDEEAVRKSAEGCHGAFLATGKVSRSRSDAEELHRLHVVGTRHALSGLKAAGVPRVVVASTSGTLAVGRDPDEVFDESSRAPLELLARWPYYRTKLYAEREALDKNQPPAFGVIVVNPSLLLGPGDLRESSTRDIRLFLERAVPAAPAGGLAFVDVRDAAVGMLLAMQRGRAGERYILNAKNLTIRSLFRRLSQISEVPAPLFNMPRQRALSLGLGRAYTRAVRALGTEPAIDEVSLEMSQYFWYCDSKKAERELGFRPRDPGETLKETVDDLVDRGVVFKKRAGAEALRDGA